MDVTTTTDVDVAADAALMYWEETVTAGSGLFFSSHAAVDVVMDSLVETTTAVDVDAVLTIAPAGVAIAASGLLFFFSSVAAATITVAANS